MPFSHLDKTRKENRIEALIFIVIGAAVMAIGFAFFIVPYNIVPGGVFSLAISIHQLTSGFFGIDTGIPVGLMGFVLILPLLLMGRKYMGPRFGTKTVLGFLLTSVFIDALFFLVGFNDPLGLANDVLLAAIVGGVLVGIGLGFIFKSKATSGGSDIIAMIISKLTGWPIGHLLVYVDTTFILIGLLVFQDWKVVIYSWITIYVTAKVVDMMVEGFNYEKLIYINSSKTNEICQRISSDLNRDGIVYKGLSVKDNYERNIIQIIVNRREIGMIEEMVLQIDKEATITVTNANEVLGKSRYEILPE